MEQAARQKVAEMDSEKNRKENFQAHGTRNKHARYYRGQGHALSCTLHIPIKNEIHTHLVPAPIIRRGVQYKAHDQGTTHQTLTKWCPPYSLHSGLLLRW